MLIICTDGQCVSHCHLSIFDGSTIYLISTDVALDSPTGYILEVDLEYPQHLHDAHADLPFCPTRDKPPGERENKLLVTLYDKKRYVIHYRNLQQSWSLSNKNSSRITIRAISMASRLYPTKYKFQNSHKQ